MKSVGFLLFPRWDMSSAITFDTIRRQRGEDPVLGSEEQAKALYFGFGFNPRHETLVIWSIFTEINKPQVINDSSEFNGNIIVKRIGDTSVV